MNLESRIALIGYGYWGKILHKNLISLGFSNIEIYDDVLGNTHLLNPKSDFYIIATPFKTHFELIKRISSFGGKKIWCEKPLVETSIKLKEIYAISDFKKNSLFVDWVYAYNPAIDFLVDFLKDKKIKQVILNRTNNGPIRHDCGSVWDLSSHDVTLLLKIFDVDSDFNFKWNEFSLKTNEEFGSNLSWSYNKGTQIIINSSWQHLEKNRISLFITNEDEIVVFDDIKKIVQIGGKTVQDFSNHESPLRISLKTFFENSPLDLDYNRRLTEKITKILENEI
jgi:hypothetical protein